MLRLLIELGANVFLQNAYGETPRRTAEVWGEILQFKLVRNL